MATIVHRYGLLAPHDGGDIVREQLRRAHRYSNTLTEIERGRRNAQRLALARFPDVLALQRAHEAAEAAVTAQLDTIRALRSRAGGVVGSEGADERAK